VDSSIPFIISVSSTVVRSSLMIQWVHLGVQVKSGEDFDLLRTLLDALGMEGRGVEEYKTYRIESFLPPVAALEVFNRKTSDERVFLELTVSDPDTAIEIVQRLGLEIVRDDSDEEPRQHLSRSFVVRLPGGTAVNITGFRTNKTGINFDGAAIQGNLSGKGRKFGIVVSRFNSFIVERLLSGALDCLYRSGVEGKDSVEIVRVPGSFEIPSAARTLAEIKKYDAIICLGCLIRGDTAHYDVIVNEVTRGIGQSAQETGVPHAFGVLTCENLEQAIDRAGLKMGNKGFEAALAAVEMANLKSAISRQPSAKKAVSRQPSAISKSKTKTRTRASSSSTKRK
jgi:6,7-dimethyl-8-ribityllumazine synthase